MNLSNVKDLWEMIESTRMAGDDDSHTIQRSTNMNPILQSISDHLRDKAAAQATLDSALVNMSAAKRILMQDWIEVRKVLNAILPHDSHMKLGMTQDNIWNEEFVYDADDVVAYVHLQRHEYLWNRQVVPIARVELTKEEWKLVMQIEEKILELGFVMVHDMVTDGNRTVWRLSMPT